MTSNFKDAFKMFMIAATAAGLAALVPAEVQARGAGGGMAGGMSASHMSSRGLMNTNGPNAADRDFGTSRAADRMSVSGAMHSKGATHAPAQLGRRHSVRHHTSAI